MESDKDMARRGVQRRLHLGTACALTTVITFALALLMGGSFGMAALMIFSLCTLTATLAFVLSARREEMLHRFANTEELALLENNGVDGCLETNVWRP